MMIMMNFVCFFFYNLLFSCIDFVTFIHMLLFPILFTRYFHLKQFEYDKSYYFTFNNFNYKNRNNSLKYDLSLRLWIMSNLYKGIIDILFIPLIFIDLLSIYHGIEICHLI
eukprot:51884_1